MWGAVSSLGTVLAVRDSGGGSSGGSASFAASSDSSGGDRIASIMGSVKSRTLISTDNLIDDSNVVCGASSYYQQHQMKGAASGNGTGLLQKRDLRYDIGTSSQYHPIRQPSVRNRPQQPMPTTDELDRRFAKVLVSIKR